MVTVANAWLWFFSKTGGMVLIAGVVRGDGGKCLALVLLKNRGYGFDCGCCPW